VNDQWCTQLGWSEEELLDRPYAELIHPDDLAATAEAAGSLAAGPAEVVDFENRYRAKDGSWRWLLWSARSDGSRIYAVAKDITQRKRLEAEREELLGHVEAMARTDELTGLANRTRSCAARPWAAAAKAAASPSPYSTWTASRTSTTATGIRLATSCSGQPRPAGVQGCARPTS
jgi:PAS domain S-box-containing protein